MNERIRTRGDVNERMNLSESTILEFHKYRIPSFPNMLFRKMRIKHKHSVIWDSNIRDARIRKPQHLGFEASGSQDIWDSTEKRSQTNKMPDIWDSIIWVYRHMGLPMMGLHNMFGNKSVTSASFIMVVFGRVSDVTVVKC